MIDIQGTVVKSLRQKYNIKIHKNPNKLPLVIWLNGAGERGWKDFSSPIEFVQNHYNFHLAVPICDDGRIWQPDNLMMMVDNIINEYPTLIDNNRIYFTGFSMGGRGVWDFATEYPYIAAAIAPISGFSCYLKAPLISHLPVWAFHGNSDWVVPSNETKKMISALVECKGNPKMTIQKKLGHDIPDTYFTTVFWDWLFVQKNRVIATDSRFEIFG